MINLNDKMSTGSSSDIFILKNNGLERVFINTNTYMFLFGLSSTGELSFLETSREQAKLLIEQLDNISIENLTGNRELYFENGFYRIKPSLKEFQTSQILDLEPKLYIRALIDLLKQVKD